MRCLSLQGAIFRRVGNLSLLQCPHKLVTLLFGQVFEQRGHLRLNHLGGAFQRVIPRFLLFKRLLRHLLFVLMLVGGTMFSGILFKLRFALPQLVKLPSLVENGLGDGN